MSCERDEQGCCPYINRDDPRCARVLRLGRLGEAFDLCLGRFSACETFAILDRQQRTGVLVTLDGRSYLDQPPRREKPREQTPAARKLRLAAS